MWAMPVDVAARRRASAARTREHGPARRCAWASGAPRRARERQPRLGATLAGGVAERRRRAPGTARRGRGRAGRPARRTSEKPLAWRPDDGEADERRRRRRTARAVDERSRSTTPTQNAARSKVVGLHQPRVLGGLAAHQRAAGEPQPAATPATIAATRPARAGRPRRSRGRRAAPRRGRPRRRRTSRRGRWPIVSRRPQRRARSPSSSPRRRWTLTRTGRGSRPEARRRRAKPPRPPEDLRAVASRPRRARIRSTARSPASTSTPARARRRRADAASLRRTARGGHAGRGRLAQATAPPASPRGRTWAAPRRTGRLRVAAVEAGEAEPIVRQVERREHARGSRGSASESAPMNSRISSIEWVAAISSVSIWVSMP